MYRTSPFLLRRVLLGVLVGTTVLALGFFGWVQLRTAQYQARETRMLSRYHAGYTACVEREVTPGTCARAVRDLCSRDGFWRREEPPFLIDIAPQFNAPDLRCGETVSG